MEIKLKKYYTSKLTIIAEPSEWDIKNDFFHEKKTYKANFPFQFYRGKKFTINFFCESCNNAIIIANDFVQYDYIDISYLSSLYHPHSFNEVLSNIFRLKGKDWGHFYGYILKEKLYSAKCFYQKCSHCNAQYLATYYDIQGQPSERTDPATPDEFYIEEMAWVEFDETEFFEEMQKK